MSTQSTDTMPADTGRALRWRVVDIVVASVLATAAGLVFVLWNVASNPISTPLSATLPGLQALLGGGWLFAGVLTALVIRKPGAALYGELVAATVSAWSATSGASSPWSPAWYRVWARSSSSPYSSTAVGGFADGRAGGCGGRPGPGGQRPDPVVPGFGDRVRHHLHGVGDHLGGALVAGLLSWFVVRSLAKTGALSRFASGRMEPDPRTR